MKHYDFLNHAQYFEALCSILARAKTGERVTIAALTFSPRSEAVTTLIEAMQAATARGVHVVFMVDAITFLVGRHELPLPSVSLHRLKTSHKYIVIRYQAIKALTNAGVECHILNVPKRRIGLVQQGRSHIKCAVYRDEVFIGGCNLAKPEEADVMVHWRDAQAAAKLASWLDNIALAGQVREAFHDVDVEAVLEGQVHVLLDAGVPKQSLIYDEAIRLIDTAEEWIYLTCQYFPGGKTAKHLAAAHARGVKLFINYSHPRAHGPSAGLHHLHQLTQHRHGLPNDFFAGRLNKDLPKLHAKVLISEHAAMIGSHNYVEQGVNLGTAELVLYSSDQEFGKRLRAFTEQQVRALGQ